jgi:hypothetical protein
MFHSLSLHINSKSASLHHDFTSKWWSIGSLGSRCFLAVSQEKVASSTSLDVFVAHEATLVFGLLELIKGYIGYNLETLHRDLKTAM